MTNRWKASSATKYVFATGVISLIACEDDSPHERDAITVMYYVLEPADTNQLDVTLYFEDQDGPEGRDPIVVSGQLQANTVYHGTLYLRFASEKSMNSIDHAISDQGILRLPESHQVFYSTSSEVELGVQYNDMDANGFPIGLSTTLTTGNGGQGTLIISIRYNVNKAALGVASGDITNAGGALDIEVAFPVHLKTRI